MSAAISTCPFQPPPGNETICQKLAREIDEMVNRDKRQGSNGGTHGLKHRFREQVQTGADGPGTKTWNDHDKAIREQQKGLRDRLNDYDNNHCGDDTPIPDDAWEWATKPRPTAKDWEKNNPQTVTRNTDNVLDIDYWEKLTGLTGLALAAYIIIFEGSRLFPPRNLVPVP